MYVCMYVYMYVCMYKRHSITRGVCNMYQMECKGLIFVLKAQHQS